MAAQVTNSGPDATITLPKIVWGIVCACSIALLGIAISSVGWGFSYSIETRARTDQNTVEIRHIQSSAERIETKLDKLIDHVMEKN